MAKQQAMVTRVWFQNLDGNTPRVLLEIDGTWREAVSPKDIKYHMSLIREMYWQSWPIMDLAASDEGQGE